MKFQIITSALALAASTSAAPLAGSGSIGLQARQNIDPTAAAHAYDGNASARKQQLISMGADSLDIAVAMMET